MATKLAAEAMQRMSETGANLAAHFLAHRSVTRDLADRVPSGGADLRPWDGAMNTVALLNHMAASHHTMVGIAAGLGVQRPDPASLPSDLDGARRLLAELTAQDEATLRALTAEQLATPREGFRNLVMPAAVWVQRAREHEAHHKGQLFTYVRMSGAEPPSGWVR